MIKKKCHQLGLPYFKSMKDANDSQDVKRINMISQVWQRKRPLNTANIRSFQFKNKSYTTSRPPWQEKSFEDELGRSELESEPTLSFMDLEEEGKDGWRKSLSDLMTSENTFSDSIF